MIISKIVQSPFEPYEKNVLWDDGKSLRVYDNGKWETRSGSTSESEIPVEITYSELKKLRDDGNLIPGTSYKIIDYKTTVPENDKSKISIEKDFDVIVTAKSKTELDHDAKASKRKQKESDKKQKFELNIDEELYTFVENGKVIYRDTEYYNYDIVIDSQNPKNPIYELTLQKPEWISSQNIILNHIGKSNNDVILDTATGTIFSGWVVTSDGDSININLFLDENRSLIVGDSYPIFDKGLSDYYGDLILTNIRDINDVSNYHALSSKYPVNHDDEILIVDSRDGKLVPAKSFVYNYPDFEIALYDSPSESYRCKTLGIVKSVDNDAYYILQKDEFTTLYLKCNSYSCVNQPVYSSDDFEMVGEVIYEYKSEIIPIIYLRNNDLNYIVKLISSGELSYRTEGCASEWYVKYSIEDSYLECWLPNYASEGDGIYIEDSYYAIVGIQPWEEYPNIIVNDEDNNLSEFIFSEIWFDENQNQMWIKYKNESKTVFVKDVKLYGDVFENIENDSVGYIESLIKPDFILNAIDNSDYFRNSDLSSWKLKYDLDNKCEYSFVVDMSQFNTSNTSNVTFVKLNKSVNAYCDGPFGNLSEFDIYIDVEGDSGSHLAICFEKGKIPVVGQNYVGMSEILLSTKIFDFSMNNNALIIDEVNDLIYTNSFEYRYAGYKTVEGFDDDNSVQSVSGYAYLPKFNDLTYGNSSIILLPKSLNLMQSDDCGWEVYDTSLNPYLNGTYCEIEIKSVSKLEITEKGNIYKMEDEFGNICEYDFKNIWWARENLNGILFSSSNTNQYIPTFWNEKFEDVTVNQNVNSSIGVYNTVLENSYDTILEIKSHLNNVKVNSISGYSFNSENLITNTTMSISGGYLKITSSEKSMIKFVKPVENGSVWTTLFPTQFIQINNWLDSDDSPSCEFHLSDLNNLLWDKESIIKIPSFRNEIAINISSNYGPFSEHVINSLDPGYYYNIKFFGPNDWEINKGNQLDICQIKFKTTSTDINFLGEEFVNNYSSDYNMFINKRRYKKIPDENYKLLTEETNELILDNSCSSDYMFNGCSTLEKVWICAPAIGAAMFRGCRNLIHVSLFGVKYLNEHAFYNCGSLTNINIPDARRIGSEAFASSHYLKTVVIGKDIMYISYDAFHNCPNLDSVYCNAVIPPEYNGNFGNASKIYVPFESVELYKLSWNQCADKIEGRVV